MSTTGAHDALGPLNQTRAQRVLAQREVLRFKASNDRVCPYLCFRLATGVKHMEFTRTYWLSLGEG